jgi:TetR/AcrR family transcriptional repressor of nem operon
VGGWSQEAGLTHGGFYNHFASQDDLAAEVCNASFAASLDVLAQAVEDGDAPAGSPQRRVVDDYLSAEHCDAADGGCPSASLVIDAGRHDETIQRSYAAGVEGCLAGFASELAREHDGELAPREARDQAVLLLSRLVGAMVLARAVRGTPRVRHHHDLHGVLVDDTSRIGGPQKLTGDAVRRQDLQVARNASEEMGGRRLEPGRGAGVHMLVVDPGVDGRGIGVGGVVPTVVATSEGLLLLREPALPCEVVHEPEDPGEPTPAVATRRLEPQVPNALAVADPLRHILAPP